MGDVIDNTLHQAQIKSKYEQYARGAHGIGIVERKIRRKNERLMIQHFGFILGDHVRTLVMSCYSFIQRKETSIIMPHKMKSIHSQNVHF